MKTRDITTGVVSTALLLGSSEDLTNHITSVPLYIEGPIFLISFSAIVYLLVKKGYSKSAKNSIFR